jgi:hypothetical protein
MLTARGVVSRQVSRLSLQFYMTEVSDSDKCGSSLWPWEQVRWVLDGHESSVMSSLYLTLRQLLSDPRVTVLPRTAALALFSQMPPVIYVSEGSTRY